MSSGNESSELDIEDVSQLPEYRDNSAGKERDIETASSDNHLSSSEFEQGNSDEDEDEEAMNLKRAQEEEKKLSNSYKVLNSRLLQQRALVMREGGIDLVRLDLEHLEGLFNAKQKLPQLSKNLQTYDAKGLSSVSDLAELSVRTMKIGQSELQLKVGDFLKSIKRYILASSFENEDRPLIKDYNFCRLGSAYLETSTRPPTIDFLRGPLTIEKKVRTVKKRAKDDLPNSSSLTTADQPNLDNLAHQQDDTAVAVMKIFKRLKTKNGVPMGFQEFFINPDSFGQSVENLFYSSFLIRDGKAKIFKQQDDWMIREVPAKVLREDYDIIKESEVEHHIFKLDYIKWQSLIDKYHITESFITSRDYRN